GCACSTCIVSQGTPACLAASAARPSTFAACVLTCSLCLASASSACRCDALVSGTLSQSNRSSTIITVILAPTDFANDNPFVTAFSASSDPSVGMRICGTCSTSRLLGRLLQISELRVQFLEQNRLIVNRAAAASDIGALTRLLRPQSFA